MSDLIDRQTLKERLMYMARFRCNSEIGEPTCGLTRRTMFHMSEIMKVVIDMPTIEERKTGKWIEIMDANEFGEPYPCGVQCSECGFCSVSLDNYCPNCGSEMRGDDHEND